MKSYVKALVGIGVMIGTSCNYSVDYSPVEIKRLDLALYDYNEMNDSIKVNIETKMDAGISTLNIMLNFGHPDDSAFVKYMQSDAVKMFTPKVKESFSDLDDLEGLLGGIKYNLSKELPQIKMGEVYSIVSPYRQSIYMADSTILLALNHYLGAGHEAYNGFDEYVKQTKEPKYIPYDVVETMISTNYPYESKGDVTILNMMLYQGAIVEAKMRIVPDAELCSALGYNEEQLNWLEANQEQAWEALVSKELLYSTSYMDSNRLFSPSLTTSIIHSDAPGRIGRYFGYKIISSYLKKNSKLSLEQMLSSEFYNSSQILIESGYNGK